MIKFWYDQDWFWCHDDVFEYGFWICGVRALSQVHEIPFSAEDCALWGALQMCNLWIKTNRYSPRARWSGLHSLLGACPIIIKCSSILVSTGLLAKISFQNLTLSFSNGHLRRLSRKQNVWRLEPFLISKSWLDLLKTLYLHPILFSYFKGGIQGYDEGSRKAFKRWPLLMSLWIYASFS